MLQRMTGTLACGFALAFGISGAALADAPLLDALFTDHVVLQRDRPIAIWGHANAGEEITVTLSGATKSVRAGSDGRWSVSMPEQPASGPHTLTARTASRMQNAHDVLVGDVWLCSGQSNMEFSVRGAMNGRAEVAASANDNIRQLRVPRASATSPREVFESPPEWKVAGPDTTGDFSAACYFYARELEAATHVPQGLVVSAWGGSKIEPWMSEAAVRAVGGYEAALDVAAEYRENAGVGTAHWGEYWKKWWLSQSESQGTQPWTLARGDTASWAKAPAELTPWETWGVPSLANFNGMVWYRAHLKLTAAQAKQAATLNLGVIDEVDLAFVNGRAAGSSACCAERSYALPAGVLKAGDNLVAVNVLDTYQAGGMYGPAEKRNLQLADGAKIPLVGWEYLQTAQGFLPPRAPWEPTAGIAMLYNAMIAPLGRYGFRGVVWYQGESNVSLPEGQRYQAQLQGLMADWRRQFDAPLPFLVVQLANFGAVPEAPVESGWALTREAQRRAVAADGNAGLAVTIDIGNRDDVHPTNKQELGRRLARAARRVIFGEQGAASVAEPAGAARSGGNVLVRFAGNGGKLVVKGSRDPSAFELCGDAPGSCRYVRATLSGEAAVTLEAGDGATPSRVRFCWGDSPLCNLYDTSGLPVGPFEIEIR